ncbi:MAG TPA: hypothetical protein VHK69_10815 [Chitinophagaceae bacterium]|jgi:hypothetical protein|nr:hypothetical protein [Chitinophagaceae bacterium]
MQSITFRLRALFLISIVTASVFYACSKESALASSGKGGSLSRFTVAGNHLYAVDNHRLYTYSLDDPSHPRQVAVTSVAFDVETIYPYNNYLFLGTSTGLYIYSIDTPSNPSLLSMARHARSCDPVVANDSVAFVTLKGNAACGPAVSGLYIHDITDIRQPLLKTTLTLDEPVGLGLQDSILYVCCGTTGLKVFNVKQPYAPILLSTQTGSDFIDVIPYNGILICYVRDGIVLYDISDPGAPQLIRKINS